MWRMTTRTRRSWPRARAALLVVGALAVAGCTGGAGDGGGAAPSPSAAAPSSTPSASASGTAGAAVPAEGPLDRDQACAAMYLEGEPPLERRVGDALVDVSERFDTESASAMHRLAQELGELHERTPGEFAGALERVRVPFVQLQEHVDTGGGETVELDVQSAVDGLKQYRALCG
jgi:hypothetical protein